MKQGRDKLVIVDENSTVYRKSLNKRSLMMQKIQEAQEVEVLKRPSQM